jgi:hypothetical protein
MRRQLPIVLHAFAGVFAAVSLFFVAHYYSQYHNAVLSTAGVDSALYRHRAEIAEYWTGAAWLCSFLVGWGTRKWLPTIIVTLVCLSACGGAECTTQMCHLTKSEGVDRSGRRGWARFGP